MANEPCRGYAYHSTHVIAPTLRSFIRAGFAAGLCLSAATVPNAAYSHDAAKELIREQRTVSVQGVKETWQLVWEVKPSIVCGPDEVFMAATCPCSGFAYAEYGRLSVVRQRGGQEIERMDLRPLFGKSDGPGIAVEDTAYLQRWPLRISDMDRERREDPKLVSDIRQRRAPTIMRFADYDRDGHATEFLLQVGTMPCGKHLFAAVGVSAKESHLHVMTSVARADMPLIMPLHAWQALLRRPGPSTIAWWNCDDHGSEVRDELVVSASNGDIRVKYRAFSCPSGGAPDKLVQETDW